MRSNAVTASVLFGALVAVVVLLSFFGVVFTPLFLAFVLAWLLVPAVDFLQRRGLNRWLAVTAVLVGVFSGIFLAGWGLVQALSSDFGNVELNLPAYAERLYSMIPQEVKVRLGIETPSKVYEQVNIGLQKLRTISFDVVKDAFFVVAGAFGTTLSFVLGMFNYLIIPVYLFYLLGDFPRLRPALVNLLPPRHRDCFDGKLSEVDDVLSAFVRGQLLVCAILAVLYSIGLYVIGIDLAIVIGVLAGVTFIIPYFGTILGIILSVVMALLKFHDILHPLLCVGWFSLVQAAEGTIITPKVVGDRVGINPVVALVCILVGGQLFGLMGMLLAIPVAAFVKIIGRTVMEMYRGSAVYREEG